MYLLIGIQSLCFQDPCCLLRLPLQQLQTIHQKTAFLFRFTRAYQENHKIHVAGKALIDKGNRNHPTTMQSHNIFAVIILVFSSRIVKANDSSLTMLETFPDDETLISLCSCKDKLLCLPLAEALNKNYTAPHVLNYIKKIEKKEVQ